MGKASSSKKIARAARAGGRASGVKQRNLLFPGAIAAIVLLGSALVVAAWNNHHDVVTGEAPTQTDHWHSAYGVYVCDAFLPTTPAAEYPSGVGIHSHADDVIHIHPHSFEGEGANATLGTFLGEIPDGQLELSDDKLTVGDQSWTSGETKCGDKVGELVVARWENVQTTEEKPEIIKKDFDKVRFEADGEGYTIAFVPKGTTDIPKPQSAAQLAELGAVDAGASPPDSTIPGETTISLPADPNATTVPVDPNATTVPVDPNATTATTGTP